MTFKPFANGLDLLLVQGAEVLDLAPGIAGPQRRRRPARLPGGKAGQRGHPAASGDQGLPQLLLGVAQRADDADAGDDDSPLRGTHELTALQKTPIVVPWRPASRACRPRNPPRGGPCGSLFKTPLLLPAGGTLPESMPTKRRQAPIEATAPIGAMSRQRRFSTGGGGGLSQDRWSARRCARPRPDRLDSRRRPATRPVRRSPARKEGRRSASGTRAAAEWPPSPG